jgi:hypothetical protein
MSVLSVGQLSALSRFRPLSQFGPFGLFGRECHVDSLEPMSLAPNITELTDKTDSTG